jgi:uncharacterized protein
MTTELRPLSVNCNLSCSYCYQEPMRLAGNQKGRKYDIDKMLEVARSTGQDFSLFGGEALLIPKKDLEIFFKAGYESKHKMSGIQTNGTLIDDDHIEMFKKYNVNVGVSIDGANELNSLRTVRGKEGDDQATLEKSTNKTLEAIQKLTNAGVQVGIIITLHKVNASKEKLTRLLSFIRWLGDIGAKQGNIHVLEVDETMPDQEIHVLSQEENIYAMLEIAKFMNENPDLYYNPFRDIYNSMQGNDKDSNCTWNNCDNMNTQGVYGIEGDGALSNCGRTNKEGIDWYKADGHGYERYISLYNTPSEYGGCKGCRFFTLCGGSCVGEGIDYDYRNKTTHCETQKALLGYFENVLVQEGITPFSKRADLSEIEKIKLNSLANGRMIKLEEIYKMLDEGTENRTIMVKG